MGLLEPKQKTRGASRRAAVMTTKTAAISRWGLILVAFLVPLIQSCQTLERFFGAEPQSEDHGLYASGTIDVRPARAKLAVDTSTRWTLSPEARARAEAILGQLATTAESFGDWVKPLLEAYLPEGQTVNTVIVIDVGLPDALRAQVDQDLVLVDAAAPMFAGKAQVLLSYARHEMVRMAFDRVFAKSLALSPAEGHDTWLLTRIARDGMVRYVTKQGEFRDGGSTLDASDEVDVYEILEDPWAPYSDKFLALDDHLREIRAPLSGKMWEKVSRDLGQMDAKSRIFASVGAYMAKAIEVAAGRAQLVEALEQGPRAFYDAYQSTRPGALMSFRLPMDLPPTVAH